MTKRTQQRTLDTRARLIAMAREIVAEAGYEALRTEEVVARAGVAKGTFFAHFSDKDTLMDLLIAEAIGTYLSKLEQAAPPETVEGFVDQLLPLMEFKTSERYVFDVILRRSGAAALSEIGPIAQTFERHGQILGRWLWPRHFRKDVPINVLVEGIQAFEMQAMALNFCAIHSAMPLRERFLPYLRAWLQPSL